MCFTKTKISSKEYGDLEFNNPSQNSVSHHNDIVLELHNHLGLISLRETREKDYQIWRSDFMLEREMHITMKTSEDQVVNLMFVLQNDIHCTLNGTSGVARKHDYNLYYTPCVVCEYAFKNDAYTLFGIQFEIEYLQRWSDSSTLLQEFLNRIKHGNTIKLVDENPTLTPAMMALIKDLQVDAYNDSLRSMYLESKVLELLRMAIEHILNRAPSLPLLRESELTQIREIHDHIHTNIHNPGSLLELARRAGMNDHKLNAGFKNLYGTTVMAFVIDLRMQLAKTMIQESTLPIKAISRLVGYNESPNFTAAFRKKFGYPPSKTKRNRF